MKERITPVGLKGNEINERMKQLMGIAPINENRKSSTIELTKKGPDGKVYGIVRENHEYYIKVTNKQANLVAEDFSYIGGLQNKKQEAYPNYANALKHLNLKFNSLNEAYGKSGQINVFKNDNLKENMGYGFSNEGNLEGNEMSECCGAQMMEGMCMECGSGGMNVYESEDESEGKNNPWAICTAYVGREDKEKYEKCVKDVKKQKGIDENITEAEYSEGVTLSEVEKAIDEMKEEELSDKQKDIAKLAGDPDKIDADDLAALRAGKKGKLSIETAISEMDGIIESVTKIELTPLYTKRDSNGFRFYSANNGAKLYAEKNGVVYNVNSDLKPTGKASVAWEKDSEKFTGLIDDKDVTGLNLNYYEKQAIDRTSSKFGGDNESIEEGIKKLDTLLESELDSIKKKV